MSEPLEDLFTISCGSCHHSAPVSKWCCTVTGELPNNHFQCPNCQRAFKRQPLEGRKYWDKFIEIVPIQAQL
jgi:transposase-like protein